MSCTGLSSKHTTGIDHVLSNGFGFGGVNASLVLRKM